MVELISIGVVVVGGIASAGMQSSRATQLPVEFRKNPFEHLHDFSVKQNCGQAIGLFCKIAIPTSHDSQLPQPSCVWLVGQGASG